MTHTFGEPTRRGGQRSMWLAIGTLLVACTPAEGKEGGRCRKSSTADEVAGLLVNGDASTHYRCDEGLMCNLTKEPYVCEPLQGPGGPCRYNDDCKDEGSCVDDRCHAKGSRGEGERCRDEVRAQLDFDVCADGLVCNPKTDTCLPLQGEGGPCDFSTNTCKEGLACGADGKCEPWTPPSSAAAP